MLEKAKEQGMLLDSKEFSELVKDYRYGLKSIKDLCDDYGISYYEFTCYMRLAKGMGLIIC